MTFIGGEAEQGLAPDIGHGASRNGREGGHRREAGERAMALLRRTFQEIGGSNPADRHADSPAWLHELYDCVLCARRDDRCAVADLAQTPAAGFIEKLRTAFLANARRDHAVSARDVLDVLAALDRVAVELRRECVAEPGSFDRGSAHEAIVEVAHDMRSPLNAIMLLVRMMLDDRELRADRAQQLGIVYSAAFGLNALVNDLVDGAQPEGRLLEPAPIPMSLAATLQSVHDIVAPVAAEKGLELCIVPPRSGRRLGHPNALQRVLLNLTTNALKYTETGSVTVSARELSRTRMEFTVSDTGRGLSRPQLSMLSASCAYVAEGQRRRRFSSAGLGLALCRTLVASMHGRIAAESVEGRGTSFRIELEMPPVEEQRARLLPDPWRDELAGDLAPTGSGFVLTEHPQRIARRAD